MRVPTVLTRQEVEAIQAVTLRDQEKAESPHQRFNAVRNEAILRLLYSTGLRVQELCNLNLDSVMLNERQLKVRKGKFGDSSYQLVEKQETLDSLASYLDLRQEVNHKGEAFFVSFYGQRILARQINRYLKDYARRAGVKKNTHAHIFRHSFGTELYRRTKDLRMVQRVLRHKRLATTEIYTHIVLDDVKAGLRKADL